jgi:3-phytase
MKKLVFTIGILSLFNVACKTSTKGSTEGKNNDIDTLALQPAIVTDQTAYDTDDPCIWVNKNDASKSLIIGTDKDVNGGLYVFDLNGKIVNKVTGLKRPNNVDVAYGIMLNGVATDFVATTERETNKLRMYSVPDMKPVDNGGLDVFADEADKAPMGIALYTRFSDHAIFAIVGRKTGPSDGYLYQYKLEDDGTGNIKGTLVRKFGKYSGKKEIESIAVDNEMGYVYYSDETYGVHKYYADPEKGNQELSLFATTGFISDHEGISIYKTSDSTGYILVSNQQKNTFMVYRREGNSNNKNVHDLIAEIPVSTVESDGSDVTNIHLNNQFSDGMFVAMSNGKVFHYYDWRNLQEMIDRNKP